MQKPARLKSGDRVAAISLSWGGPGAIPHRYHAGKDQFQREFGIDVVETPCALRDPDWLARNPKARADDLMEAFSDPTINGIISTIGGDDSIRVLSHLDLSVIRDHPKIFMGFSDTTATHIACFQAGLVSFYGPSFMAGFAENAGMFPYMVQSIRRTLFSIDPIGIIEPNQAGWTAERLEWTDPANQNRRRALSASTGWKFLQGQGIARGHLLGGCMDVLEFLKGTPWWPPADAWNNAILFLETSEEAPSPLAVERWLRNYGSQGILHRISGLLVGRPGGHRLAVADFNKYDSVIRKVVSDELRLPDLPVITQMDFGHTDPMFTIPYGVSAAINCDRCTLEITESAVV